MRILWIGAHPDDELFVAPWLARLRTTAGAKLGFLIATRGEQGDCQLAGPRDVGAVREAEMRAAASLFDADLQILGWRDGVAAEPHDVLHAWTNDAGGKERLRRQLREAIGRFAPDWIVTFDRRHGCSWHADHRALGALVQSLALPLPVTLAESRITFSAPLRIEPGVAEANAVDVSDTWETLLLDLASHPSQFSEETIELFRNAPAETRIVWLQHLPAWRRWRYVRDNLTGSAFRMKSFIRDRIAPRRSAPALSHDRH
ncbi:MAG: mycothiol S-conjugate amidase [Thermoanaerobaculia bacterium]|jgi:LmbE family N-acetylglucosaminyl deacetylase|nr:mycothiol S-conjugate amidase [Thermoanaerobaculia bacterium]